MSNKPNNQVEEVVDEHRLIAERREKLNKLRAEGNAFPNDWKREDYAIDLHDKYGDKDKSWFDDNAIEASVAGRMVAKRVMGKASFASISDMSGRIQLYVARDNLPEGEYARFKTWDIGDIAGAKGTLFKTQKGELSILVSNIKLLTKSVRPLPDKFHGLTDTEQRYRQRYLDLATSEESRKVFRTRSKIISFFRDYFNQRDFLEVETPMMQVIPGGATARPFVTHHNALDLDMYLRIAPELYLKRLVVGGFEKVYEINRNFRNEGLSTRHNPEFTMIEFYEAYATYHDLMDLTEDLLRQLTQDVLGTTQVPYQGEVYDFGQPFERLSVVEAAIKYAEVDDESVMHNLGQASSLAESLGIEVKKEWGLGKVQIEIFEKVAEHRLMNPTFITEYPAEVSPLARRNDENPFVTDRFEFFVGGREIANGFSELNDYEDQAERFNAQVQAKDAGDDEAMFFDEDYVCALEHGMPPTAGQGIGIDRLVMLLTDSPSIRDVLLFPHMRPLHSS